MSSNLAILGKLLGAQRATCHISTRTRKIVTLSKSVASKEGWAQLLKRRVTDVVDTKFTIVVEPGSYSYGVTPDSLESNILEVPAGVDIYASLPGTAFFPALSIVEGVSESTLRGLHIDNLVVSGSDTGPVELSDCHIGTLVILEDCEVHLTGCEVGILSGEGRVSAKGSTIANSLVSDVHFSNVTVDSLLVRLRVSADRSTLAHVTTKGDTEDDMPGFIVRNSSIGSLETLGGVPHIRATNCTVGAVSLSAGSMIVSQSILLGQWRVAAPLLIEDCTPGNYNNVLWHLTNEDDCNRVVIRGTTLHTDVHHEHGTLVLSNTQLEGRIDRDVTAALDATDVEFLAGGSRVEFRPSYKNCTTSTSDSTSPSSGLDGGRTITLRAPTDIYTVHSLCQ